MKLLSSLALVGLLGYSSLVAADYKIDVDHSDIGFKVKHMMISNVKGNFEKFSGAFYLDEKTKTFSSLNGVVEVVSITTQNQKRDDHLRSSAFFDVTKYPTMKLKLIEQKGDKAMMEMTIKDVTKIIEMEIEDISGTVKDPWGNTRVGFVINGKINRKDFHVNFHKLLETGGLLVDDIIKLNFELEGIAVK